jgi:hypothetical protein
MTIATVDRAALAVGKKYSLSAQLVGFVPLGLRMLAACLVLAVLTPAVQARAEAVRVSASADAGLSQTQARQQALDRALLDAVSREARNMLPAPATEVRLKALREHLAPHALDYVQSYHEIIGAKPTPEQQAEQATIPTTGQPSAVQKPQTAPVELELDVEVNRAYLRQTLIRLGFFAGGQHPGIFVLRLGTGVTEKDAKALDPANALLGLSRGQQNTAASAPEVSLERLPQGYHKAVLRQGTRVLAADAPELGTLWLDVWGKYFAELERQAGPGMQRLTIVGFASVDAVLEFYQALSSWDDALQDAKLGVVGFAAQGMSAQITCRVTSQERLDARLRPALQERKLTLTAQSGVAKAGIAAP